MRTLSSEACNISVFLIKFFFCDPKYPLAGRVAVKGFQSGAGFCNHRIQFNLDKRAPCLRVFRSDFHNLNCDVETVLWLWNYRKTSALVTVHGAIVVVKNVTDIMIRYFSWSKQIHYWEVEMLSGSASLAGLPTSRHRRAGCAHASRSTFVLNDRWTHYTPIINTTSAPPYSFHAPNAKSYAYLTID